MHQDCVRNTTHVKETGVERSAGDVGKQWGAKWIWWKLNLVPRVLGLFGQRVSARRDSGIIDLNYIFDWPLA